MYACHVHVVLHCLGFVICGELEENAAVEYGHDSSQLGV